MTNQIRQKALLKGLAAYLVILSVFFISLSMTGCSTNAHKNYAPVWPSTKDGTKTKKHNKKYYLVKQGDTLYSISFRAKINFKTLAVWNNLSPPYELGVGQRVRLYSARKLFKKRVVRKKTVAILPKRRRTSQKSNRIERSSSQKKPTISIDKTKVLKFNPSWPVRGKIVKTFSQTDNTGIDIRGNVGQKVRAVDAGKIVYSGSGLKTYGNLLIIKHNDLYLSAYAYNQKLFVNEGQFVDKGQVIAEMGGVGRKKALLHFEIRKNGNSVNPINFLPE